MVDAALNTECGRDVCACNNNRYSFHVLLLGTNESCPTNKKIQASFAYVLFSPVLHIFLMLLKHSRFVIILLAGVLVSNKAERLIRLLGFCGSFVYVFCGYGRFYWFRFALILRF